MAEKPFITDNPDGLVKGRSFKAEAQSFEAYREDSPEDEFITITDCRMTKLPNNAPHWADIINQFNLDPQDTIIVLYINGIEMVDTQHPEKSTAQGNCVYFVFDDDNLYDKKIDKRTELRIKKTASFYHIPVVKHRDEIKGSQFSNITDSSYKIFSFSEITNVLFDPDIAPSSSSPSSSHRTFQMYLYP